MLKSWFWKKHIFEDDFLSNFRRFGFRKCLQNQPFFQHFSKISILQKSCSRLDGSSMFRVRSLQKPTKNRFENAFQNNIEKTCQKIEFWQPFWPPKSASWPPKSLSWAPKSVFAASQIVFRLLLGSTFAFLWVWNRFWVDFGGPRLRNRAFLMIRTNAFGQPPYALPGAETPSKICKKLRKNWGFHYNPLLIKFNISSTLLHLWHNFVKK